MQPTYGVDPGGDSRALALDERGRVLISPFPNRTRAGLCGRALDWMGDNLPATVLLFAANVQLGVIIWLLVR